MYSPHIEPPALAVKQSEPIQISGDLVLMFGMIEGSARIKADVAVYDPQNGARPVLFSNIGSKARRLAVVCNEGEAKRLANAGQEDAPKIIMTRDQADVVVVKQGANGARVVTKKGEQNIPAYVSDSVFGIGSGDIFAAGFTCAWGMRGMLPGDAADWASRAVANYVATRQERFPREEEIRNMKPIRVKPGSVYLAAPFFTMAQRWLVEETRALFLRMGLEVFSPLHDVGFGPPDEVAPADLIGLENCDRVFAVVDGLDAGSIFEIGYARKLGRPVYAYTELIGDEDCKMIAGSGCAVFRDYVSAIHATAWNL